MSSPEQNHGPKPEPTALSKRELQGRVMWTCLGLTVPFGIIAAYHKLDAPWGTIEALLLLVAFVCAVLRCFSSDKSSHKNLDGVEPNGSIDPKKPQ
jgi:hypothetical protein